MNTYKNKPITLNELNQLSKRTEPTILSPNSWQLLPLPNKPNGVKAIGKKYNS